MSKQQTIKKEKIERFLDFHVLNYMYHHPNTPFNAKTLHFAVAVGKNSAYKKNYFESIVGKLRNFGYLYEPEVGIYVFTPRNFIKIKKERPLFAKEIMIKPITAVDY